MTRVVLSIVLVSFLALPVGSQVQSGLQWIDVEGAQRAKLRAVVFRPEGSGPFPIVVYLHGSSGMDDADVRIGATFAREGFITLVGCWFRGTDLVQGKNPCPNAPTNSNIFAVQNAIALMDAGRQVPGARRDRVGLVGFSRGGGLAAAVASSPANFQVAVAISGRFDLSYSGDAASRSPSDVSALSQVQNLRVPLLILHGTADERAKPEMVREYEHRARALGKTVEAYYIEGGHHAMYFDPRFKGEVFRRAVEFVKKYLRP